MKIILIIPSYNEEDNILDVKHEIDEYNQRKKNKVDYIFINDCSKDSSDSIFKEHSIKNIKLVYNLGIGGAVQTGYKYALENNYDIAIQFDGDNQHDINFLDNIINPIVDNKCDMVIGSRFVDKTDGFKSSITRRIGIRIISLFTKLTTGKKIYDTTSGFRAINKKLIKEFSNSYPTEYPEPVSNVTVLKKGYVIKEIAVQMKERKTGTSSIKSWKNIYYMINVVLLIIINGIRRDN